MSSTDLEFVRRVCYEFSKTRSFLPIKLGSLTSPPLPLSQWVSMFFLVNMMEEDYVIVSKRKNTLIMTFNSSFLVKPHKCEI